MFTDWSKDDWKKAGFDALFVLCSFAFFRGLQFIVRWYLFGKCTFRTFSYFAFRRRGGSDRNATADSTTLSSIPPNKKWRICNEIVSLIHAGVSGLWAAYAIAMFPKLIEDMIGFREDIVLKLIFLSMGYLLHDLLDLLINERSVRIIELLFHHIVVLTAFAITLFTGKFLGVVVFGLLMECNSVFLHTRSLLNLYGVSKKQPSFRIVALLNMVTLIVFRMAVSLYLTYWLVTECIGHYIWYFVIPCFFVIISLLCTNTVLAYRVMAADGLFGKKRSRGPPTGTTNAAVDEGDDEDKSSSSDEDDIEAAPAELNAVPPTQQLVSNGSTEMA